MNYGVLFVSGCHDDAHLLSRMLRAVPLRLDHAESLEDAQAPPAAAQ